MSQTTDLNLVETYTCGNEGMIVGLCENLKIPDILNRELTHHLGRTPEIPYGILGMMMIVNMIDRHHPLSGMKEYYQGKDLEGIFHYFIDINQLNDDRLGRFLDALFEAGPQQVYSQVAVSALKYYGIKVKTLNFDTTSKVMWGLYETPEGTEGEISIDFGHSKDKRSDKKQIKFGICCANGLPIDAQVLSGNKDDKTYNHDVLERVDDILDLYDVDRSQFYYIADSALFSKDNLEVAKKHKVHLITRMPDNVTLCRTLMDQTIDSFDSLENLTRTNAKGKLYHYQVMEKEDVYHDNPLKLVCYHSESLQTQKSKGLEKKVDKEQKNLKKISKTLKNREFACLKDAQREQDKLLDKDLKKAVYHQIDFTITTEEKRKPGRPSKKPDQKSVEIVYKLSFTFTPDAKRMEEELRKACMFVLCSTDITLTPEQLLQEYKTQDETEKRFMTLKSTEFVNSLFLDSPRRIEAFGYLMLLAVLVLSVAEYVIRRELEERGDYLLGNENRKVKRPTIKTILRMIRLVCVRVIKHPEKPWERSIAKEPSETILKILEYLLIPLERFTKGVC